MIIGPSLVIIVFCNLLVASLITSVAANINHTYFHDKKAKDLAISASSVGFGGIGLLIGFLLFNKMYMNINRVYLYSLLWMWVILVALSVLTYLTYDKLLSSYHYPVGAVNTINKTEKRLAFSAFCLSLVGISVGLTYVITTGIHEGYFDNLTGNIFNVKSFFQQSKNTGKTIDIELNDLISDLNDTNF